MHIRLWCILIIMIVKLCPSITQNRSLRMPASRSFFLYRTNSVNEKACTCSSPISCSCCETVTLIYSKMRKKLCSNFMYQRNGLNVDISMNTDTIKTTTITNFRPFKLCTNIPGSLFSAMCVDVMELNQFPRSITICVRHEILSKIQEWQINYTCVSISTILPMVAETTTGMTMTMSTPISAGASISMTPRPSTPTTTMRTTTRMTPMASVRPSSSMAVTTRPTGANSPPTSTTVRTITMNPSNGTSRPVPAQTGVTAPGTTGARPAGSGRPPPMMPAQGKRRKRDSGILEIRKINGVNNNRYLSGRIVNENIVNKVPSDRIAQIAVGPSFSVPNDAIAVNYNNEGSLIPVSFTVHDRSEYFPSRIPPSVALTLKDENIRNHGNDDILFVTDYNVNSFRDKTDSVIFPN